MGLDQMVSLDQREGFDKTAGLEKIGGVDQRVGLDLRVALDQKVGLAQRVSLDLTVGSLLVVGLNQTIDQAAGADRIQEVSLANLHRMGDQNRLKAEPLGTMTCQQTSHFHTQQSILQHHTRWSGFPRAALWLPTVLGSWSQTLCPVPSESSSTDNQSALFLLL